MWVYDKVYVWKTLLQHVVMYIEQEIYKKNYNYGFRFLRINLVQFKGLSLRNLFWSYEKDKN